MTNRKVTVTSDAGEDMSAELEVFAKGIGLERAASGRYSILLLLGLFGGVASGRLNPAKVVHEINALEGIGGPSKLKPPIQNKHPPLKGLWHKHYMEGGLSSLAMNLRKALNRYGLPWFEQRIQEAQASGEDRYLEFEDVKSLVDDAVTGNFQRLAEAEAMTGEWLVYAQYEGRNYYLCLATHDISQHQNLRQQIDVLCCQEFPFLADMLANA